MLATVMPCSTPGLSPRVRGSPGAAAQLLSRRGIIPACAGKPSRRCAAPGRPWDYPRVCGEATLSPIALRQTWGLSPRVRGSRALADRLAADLGIIPACAGKPHPAARRRRGRGDYPRVCGEASIMATINRICRGLSPRVRGSHGAGLPQTGGQGIIPACAGKPGTGRAARGCTEDYPRVCGEAPLNDRPPASQSGLSPRVRGSRDAHVGRRTAAGIIPACAGKPRRSADASLPAGDYPRVCGEAGVRVRESLGNLGLSPRVRGSPLCGTGLTAARGIIPACAGKPATPSLAAKLSTDYPRVCGEAAAERSMALQTEGLSPRVRGSPAGRPLPPPAPWIIPACAGKPLGWHAPSNF